MSDIYNYMHFTILSFEALNGGAFKDNNYDQLKFTRPPTNTLQKRAVNDVMNKTFHTNVSPHAVGGHCSMPSHGPRYVQHVVDYSISPPYTL